MIVTQAVAILPVWVPAGAVKSTRNCSFPSRARVFASYSRLLLKYFLSEGIMCGHSVFLASASEQPADMVKVTWESFPSYGYVVMERHLCLIRCMHKYAVNKSKIFMFNWTCVWVCSELRRDLRVTCLMIESRMYHLLMRCCTICSLVFSGSGWKQLIIKSCHYHSKMFLHISLAIHRVVSLLLLT